MRYAPLSLVLLLAACLDTPTKSVRPMGGDNDPSTGLDASADGSANPGARDAAPDATHNGGDGKPSGDGSMSNTGDSAVPQACTTNADCTERLASRCDTGMGVCVPCAASSDCKGFPGATVCIVGEGCFECSESDKDACTNDEQLCDPTLHECVVCTDANPSACDQNTTPLCANNTCVECLVSDDCDDENESACNAYQCEPCDGDEDCEHFAQTDRCNTSQGKCVECLSSADCGTDEPFCDQGACRPCESNNECPNGTVCDEADGPTKGQCVECTQDPTEESAQCGTKSCNPATRACTNTNRGSASICQACVADSECEADHRCIAMTFGGEELGGFCLKRAAGGCTKPWGAEPINRVSLSGASAEAYCGVAEDLTSCEAVLALLRGGECPSGVSTECAPHGARCASVNFIANSCTYPCETSNECPNGYGCPTSGADRYCGK